MLIVTDSFATPWAVAHQAPLTMGFPRQEYWAMLPFPSPGDFPVGLNMCLLLWQAGSLPLTTREAHTNGQKSLIIEKCKSNQVSPLSSEKDHHQKVYK